MALAIALTAAVLAATSAAPDTTGSGPAVPQACAPLDSALREAPGVAADVAGTLATHGGVVRWLPERGPVRVWVQPRPATLAGPGLLAAGWSQAVRDGADSWQGVVPGLALVIVGDSARADVRVTWGAVPATPTALLGAVAPDGRGDTQALAYAAASAVRPAARTALAATADGRAAAALVVLALEGEAALDTPDAVRTVVRHEFGHVLGLAHHAAPRSVMAPVVRATRLAPGDRDALRLLYRLPPGARCRVN